MNICRVCDQPIAPDFEQSGCVPGVHYHRICFDISVASLKEELKVFFRRPDSGFEELPNGTFREKSKP